MRAIGAKRQRPRENDRGKIEWRVEVREERAAARDLVTQILAELSRIDADEQEIVRARKIFGSRLADLAPRREMDEAVALVDGRARKGARLFGLKPEIR